jgi:hypothetical protein
VLRISLFALKVTMSFMDLGDMRDGEDVEKNGVIALDAARVNKTTRMIVTLQLTCRERECDLIQLECHLPCRMTVA